MQIFVGYQQSCTRKNKKHIRNARTSASSTRAEAAPKRTQGNTPFLKKTMMKMLAARRFLLTRSSSLAIAPPRSRSYHYNKGTAKDMMEKSCYHGVNFVIAEDASVFDAITRMAGINLGCLAVSSKDGKFTGVVTERDYLKKVELQNLTAKDTKISQIMTKRARLIVAEEDETPAQLMTKMLSSDIRHLPVLNGDGDLVGMLSIKDIVREINREYDADMDTLSSFALGKGGHFVLD